MACRRAPGGSVRVQLDPPGTLTCLMLAAAAMRAVGSPGTRACLTFSPSAPSTTVATPGKL